MISEEIKEALRIIRENFEDKYNLKNLYIDKIAIHLEDKHQLLSKEANAIAKDVLRIIFWT